MGSFRCWCLLLLTGALFGSGALAYPDEDDFWKKENDIQTVREDNWFQIDEEDGDMTLVSRVLLGVRIR